MDLPEAKFPSFANEDSTSLMQLQGITNAVFQLPQ